MAHPLNLLVIGGTRFLGRHFAALALERGHRVTLLNRGRSGPGLFPAARHLVADRNDEAGLRDALAGDEPWDAVIDPSGYFPRQVRTLAAVLAGRVRQFQFVSSISVYADFDRERTDESAPLATLADPTVEQITGETYGGLKALCERAASEGFGTERTLLVRPGLIVGPFDPSGRFTWWVQRAHRGGELLAPGDPAAPVQFIDARDLAAWMLLQAERGSGPGSAAGTFNLTGPTAPLTMGAFIDTLVATLAPAGTRPTWVDDAFLQAHEVAPWSALPVYLPPAQAGLHRVDIARAAATGLVCRPLADTLRDTAAWAAAAPGGGLVEGFGLAPEREQALLDAWRARPTA